MTNGRWKPNVTVATVVETIIGPESRYLLVQETSEGSIVFNQPAGHLEANESLLKAAIRETREESAWDIQITHYLGVYRYIAPNGMTYLRHGFAGKPIKHHPNLALDSGILGAVWMNYEEILQHNDQMRSPLVIQLIDDYRSGKRYPLAVLNEV